MYAKGKLLQNMYDVGNDTVILSEPPNKPYYLLPEFDFPFVFIVFKKIYEAWSL